MAGGVPSWFSRRGFELPRLARLDRLVLPKLREDTILVVACFGGSGRGSLGEGGGGG